MRRFIGKRWVIVGVVALVAIASAALAVILGSARINQNSAQSGEIPPPLPSEVVAIALSTRPRTSARGRTFSTR